VAVTHPDLRASDEDRQRIVAALQRHTAAGRLTLDEFANRTDQALAAATQADLAGVVSDLPIDVPEPVGGSGSTQRWALLLSFLIATITLVVLGLVLAAGR
jgi:hypothetical protein